MIWAAVHAAGEFLAAVLFAGGLVLLALGVVGAVRHRRSGRRMTPD